MSQINITHNPKFDLFIASVPGTDFREIAYSNDGKVAVNGDPVVYTRSERVKVNHVLAIASTYNQAMKMAERAILKK